MYGFLSIPKNAYEKERMEYRKHMCSLCDSLHENFGIKGRLYTNFDLTTISVVVAAIDGSISNELQEPSKIICTRPLLYNNPPEIFSFFSAISVMIAYCKKYDAFCEENNVIIPPDLLKNVEIADKILSKYKLERKYFESTLNNQHNLEGKVEDINLLSQPTGEMISRILTTACNILNKELSTQYIQELGTELGKLIYIYDGLSDYQKDLKVGAFNCVQKCFIKKRPPSPELADEIIECIQTIKGNIATIIDKINFPNDSALVKLILLQDISVRESKSENYVKNFFCSNFAQLNRQIIFGIISGSLIVQTVVAESEKPNDFVCFLFCCALCSCGYICCTPPAQNNPCR